MAYDIVGQGEPALTPLNSEETSGLLDRIREVGTRIAKVFQKPVTISLDAPVPKIDAALIKQIIKAGALAERAERRQKAYEDVQLSEVRLQNERLNAGDFEELHGPLKSELYKAAAINPPPVK